MLKKSELLVCVSLIALIVVGTRIPLPLSSGAEVYRGTIYVDDNASPSWYDETHVATIQEGVNNASVGDTIYVWSGMYHENVDVGKPVTVIGNGSSTTVVDAVTFDDPVFDITIDYVHLSGFTITGATGYQTAGISLQGVGHCVISTNCVSGNYWGISLYNSSTTTVMTNTVLDNYPGSGICLSGSSNNTLTGNTISYNYPGSGINLSGSSANTIAGNDVSYNAYGISLSHSRNNMIMDNDAIDNYQGTGISLSNSSNNTITINTAQDNYWGITLYNSSANAILGNAATDNYIFGISLANSSNNTITSNNVLHNFDSGIHLSSSCHTTITGNNVSYNQGYGISLSGSSNNSIYNNYVNNTHNAYDPGANLWNITKSSGSNIMGGPYLGGNYWSDYRGIDTNGDGIGDTPYTIPGGVNQDHSPLVNPREYMTLEQGWNLITVPFTTTMTADTLGHNISGCTTVIMLNASSQTFLTHIVGVPWDDFPIRDGVGYFVYCLHNSGFRIGGLPIPSVNVTILEYWNLIGWYQGNATTAESLGQNISGCSVVTLFDAQTQTFLTHVVNTPHDNFPVTRGMGLFLYATEVSYWHGEG